MKIRSVCIAAVFLGLSSVAASASESGMLHRVSCSVVRYYVAKYSASMAEQWARAKGASDAEIEAARRCLNTEPVRTARARPLALGAYGW
jgi:hypothetical protein